jgi:transketolase
MRKEFAAAVQRCMEKDDRIIFLTGDLGFAAFENLQLGMKKRFVNVGVCEQNMISMAAGLASEGLLPICYSIAPFAVFRPAEQIRIDVCYHNMNVKIVGNGGGYGYGIMGATHHALEDLAFLSSLPNMRCYIPLLNDDLPDVVDDMLQFQGPCYLRLGYGRWPAEEPVPAYQPLRHLLCGDQLTVVGTGPVLLNALRALAIAPDVCQADLFALSELPVGKLPEELRRSLLKTKKLLVIEEHVQRGGLAENLAYLLLSDQISVRFQHCCALGYPNNRYGSQGYHWKVSGLDPESLARVIQELLNE